MGLGNFTNFSSSHGKLSVKISVRRNEQSRRTWTRTTTATKQSRGAAFKSTNSQKSNLELQSSHHHVQTRKESRASCHIQTVVGQGTTPQREVVKLTKLQIPSSSRLPGIAQQKRALSIHEYLSADLLRSVSSFPSSRATLTLLSMASACRKDPWLGQPTRRRLSLRRSEATIW